MIGEYFVLRVLNTKTHLLGYVIQDREGIKVSSEYISTVKQFATKEEANTFAVKLKTPTTKTFTISSKQLIKEGLGEKAKGKFYVVKSQNKYLHYDAKAGYHFKPGYIGCCMWYDRISIQAFILANHIDGVITPMN